MWAAAQLLCLHNFRATLGRAALMDMVNTSMLST